MDDIAAQACHSAIHAAQFLIPVQQAEARAARAVSMQSPEWENHVFTIGMLLVSHQPHLSLYGRDHRLRAFSRGHAATLVPRSQILAEAAPAFRPEPKKNRDSEPPPSGARW